MSLRDRCQLCPRPYSTTLVLGEGPEPARFLFIGEGPGQTENRHGRPFCGASGQELDYTYLQLAGLEREEIRITNILKCLPPFKSLDAGNTKHKAVIDSCVGKFIAVEIIRCQPEAIVTLGAIAAGLFPEIDLGMQHGIPVKCKYDLGIQCQWEGYVIPMYHPAAAMHQGVDEDDIVNYGTMLRDDFENMKPFANGVYKYPVDRHAGREIYVELRNEDDWRVMAGMCQPGYLESGGLDYMDAATDTEVDTGHKVMGQYPPYCLSFSLWPGTGFVIRADNREMLAWFRRFISARYMIFHNFPYDSSVYKLMDIHFRPRRYDDTMERAYHLQNMPQRLKALAYRLCGMRMQEYLDLVGPYARDRQVAYLEKASVAAFEQVLRPRQQPVHKRANRILNDMKKRPDTDPYKRWYLIPEDEREPVEQALGPIPAGSLTMVPWDKVVYYSARDSDATLRVRPELIGKARDLRRIA